MHPEFNLWRSISIKSPLSRTCLADLPRRPQVPFDIIEEDTYSIVKKLNLRAKRPVRFALDCDEVFHMRMPKKLELVRQLWSSSRRCGGNVIFEYVFGAKLKAMPAKLLSDDARHVFCPPFYCREKLTEWSKTRDHPILLATFVALRKFQRQKIKEMLIIGIEISRDEWIRHCEESVQYHAVSPCAR